jgi:hypothetical protein
MAKKQLMETENLQHLLSSGAIDVTSEWKAQGYTVDAGENPSALELDNSLWVYQHADGNYMCVDIEVA